MPRSTRQRIRPKVKTLPPRIGLSIRYQRISIRKNAKPTTAAAGSTNHAGASSVGDVAEFSWGGMVEGTSLRAFFDRRTSNDPGVAFPLTALQNVDLYP